MQVKSKIHEQYYEIVELSGSYVSSIYYEQGFSNHFSDMDKAVNKLKEYKSDETKERKFAIREVRMTTRTELVHIEGEQNNEESKAKYTTLPVGCFTEKAVYLTIGQKTPQDVRFSETAVIECFPSLPEGYTGK